MERLKWIVLLCLWVLWATIIATKWGTSATPARVPLTFVSGQRLPRVESSTAPGLPRLATWRRVGKARPPFPVPKNIFAPLPGSEKQAHKRPKRVRPPTPSTRRPITTPPSAPAVYVPPALRPAPPPPSPEEVAAQQLRLQREAAEQQARQSMAQYRYLGYLAEQGEVRAFLGKGQDLYIVRAGDLLEGQIHVTTIDAAGLMLRDALSSVERLLALTSNVN